MMSTAIVPASAPEDQIQRRDDIDEGLTQEDVDEFVVENRQWLTEEAEEVLRNMVPKDQASVIREGSMSNCRDPVAIVKSRAWQGHLRKNREWVEERKALPIDMAVEDFLEANAAMVNEEAEQVIRSMSPTSQRHVIDGGSLSGCRDPVAIIKTRAKQGKGKGKGKGKKGKGKGKDKWGWGWDWGWGYEEEWMDPEDQRKAMQKEENVKMKEKQQMENLAAVNEGRCLYVVGLPPLWTPNQLEDFFGHQGRVLRAHMMAVKPGTGSRAAFVNFASARDASSAASVCDQLEVEDRGEKYLLECTVKRRTGEKTYGKRYTPSAEGQAGYDRARSEMRVAFISRLPLDADESSLRQLCRPCGTVEEVHMLPSNNINQACFVTMAAANEAAVLIQSLNGAAFYGNVLVACYPREREDKKRRRPENENQPDEFMVEIRNFPHWTEVDDLRAVLETSKHEVQRLKILNHDPRGLASLARAHFASAAAMYAVVKTLQGFEFTPGYPLSLTAVPPASTQHQGEFSAGPPQGWTNSFGAGVNNWNSGSGAGANVNNWSGGAGDWSAGAGASLNTWNPAAAASVNSWNPAAAASVNSWNPAADPSANSWNPAADPSANSWNPAADPSVNSWNPAADPSLNSWNQGASAMPAPQRWTPMQA